MWLCDDSVVVVVGSVHCLPQHCKQSQVSRVASGTHCDVSGGAVFDGCLGVVPLSSFVQPTAFVVVVPRYLVLLQVVARDGSQPPMC